MVVEVPVGDTIRGVGAGSIGVGHMLVVDDDSDRFALLVATPFGIGAVTFAV